MNQWESETIFHDSNAFYEAILAAVEAAQESIDFEVYIFRDDFLGQRFLEALKRAVSRRVQVRMVVDGFGSADWATRGLPDCVRAGVDARVFRPMPWFFFSLTRSAYFSFRTIFKLFAAINRRNHRKFWVVDGRIAFVGSQNITLDHLSFGQGGHGWRDTGISVQGSAIRELIQSFETVWALSWQMGTSKSFFSYRRFLGRKRMTSDLVRLNDRIGRRRQLFLDLLSRIESAQHRLWITNPYFIPSRRLVSALIQAAKRGVDVRILLPQKSDVLFIRFVSAVFFGQLLISGVRIFEYLPAVLHAKVLQVDEWAIVGSSNLNHRSLLHDLEVDLVVTHPESRQKLAERFLHDLTESREVTLNLFRRRSHFSSFLGWILFRFRRFL